MRNELKSAFDAIRAEDSLKSNTTQFLFSEIQKQNKTRYRFAFKKHAAAFACVITLFLTAAFAYNVYFTPAAYVDVDVNPSIELILNRFDRIISARAYNSDGANIIEGLPIKHKSYGDALVILIDAIAGHGYLQNGELVSVTLQMNDKNRESELLSSIQTEIESYMTSCHHTAQIDVFPVSGNLRNNSYEQGVSPAKYLAIQELIEVDPTASVENCRGHSISEIKQLTREHGGHHGGSNDGKRHGGCD